MSASSSNLQQLRRERREFYRKFLQTHQGESDTAWTINVLARRKYDPTFPYQNAVLAREIMRAEIMSEQEFLDKLDLVDFKARQWKDRKTGKGPPDRIAWVFYMSANPLDERKAYFATKYTLDQNVTDMAVGSSGSGRSNGGSSGFKSFSSIPSLYRSSLEKNPYRKYIKLDVDTKDPKHLLELKQVLHATGTDITLAVETRGGYHVLLPVGANLKQLYDLRNKIVQASSKSDAWLTVEPPGDSPRVVIPGTYQSDFTPSLMENHYFFLDSQEQSMNH
jgi:hypothetical protein